MTGGWEIAEASTMLESAERIATEAVEIAHRQADRAWASRTSILTPSHAMLTIHEIVAPRDRARSHRRLRGQLRRHELREAVATSAS